MEMTLEDLGNGTLGAPTQDLHQQRQDGSNPLVPAGSSIPGLYGRMQAAIAQCYSVDDCKHIAAQADAIALYYKQIQDDASVVKFLQVKLRAWRRIAEILVNSGVDRSACETTAEYIRKIRAVFKDQKTIQELNEGLFRQLLKIVAMPSDFFDQNAGRYGGIEALVRAFADFQHHEWAASPQGRAELKAREAQQAELVRQQKEQQAEEAKQQAEQAKQQAEQAQQQAEQQAEQTRQRQEEIADLKALKTARDAAFAEVGITLDRRDRKEMHQIVFLLKKPIYETLRQAAFDHRMTMQAVLRSGLRAWLAAHNYAVSADDLPPGKIKG
jgi:hypothetical protein